MVDSSHPTTRRLREIWAYTAQDATIRGQLLLKVAPSGRLALGMIGRDGDWTFGDDVSRLPSGLYTVNFGRWAAVLKELETLINDPACDEGMLQSFFETYPEWELLRIVIFRPVLRRETGMIELEEIEHEYDHSAASWSQLERHGPHRGA